jgi:uncharacterized protein with GYD domain
MATYFMFGKYSNESIKEISADRTEKGKAVVEENGGQLQGGYAMLGENDLVLIVDFPGTAQVMKASAALTELLGISFSSTPVVSIEEFDKFMTG